MKTTFNIPASAEEYIEIESEQQLQQLVATGALRKRNRFILGGGSNVVFAHHFEGVVLHATNRGIRIEEPEGNCDSLRLVTAAAGENWDDFVHFCSSHQCHGLENLVAIPGDVGAAPVQNVGAYGSEAKDCLYSVRTIDLEEGSVRRFTKEECQFAYRDSFFKRHPNRYFVTEVTFALSPTFTPNLSYRPLAEKFGGGKPDAEEVMAFITDLRWSKLPKPEVLGSAGSFFKNPIVSEAQYKSLLGEYPDLVAFPAQNGYKLAAGWLIEKAGWKGRKMGRCGVYEKQALVLVNHGGCTGEELMELSEHIVADIERRFHVRLEKEAIVL